MLFSAYVTFYGTTSITSILFLRLAMRWGGLNKAVSSPRLDEYVDPYIQLKCSLAAVIILSLALRKSLRIGVINYYNGESARESCVFLFVVIMCRAF